MSLALGVLVSGSGSNLQAILDAIGDGRLDASLRVVISSRPGVRAIERAERAGVPVVVLRHTEYPSREAFDQALVLALREHAVSWVALAGFMRVLTPVFLRAFKGKVVNIHPSLLPAFPGVDAQGQAFRYGVKVTGCTVHFVDEGVDTGPVIAQGVVPVLATDTDESLRARILAEEHRLLPEVLGLIAAGRVTLVETAEGRARVAIAELP